MAMSEIALAVASGTVGVALIDKVYKFGEGALRPRQIRRVAEAESEADIRDVELRLRAAERLLAEETFKQGNLDQIVLKSLGLIDESVATPDRISDDWIANFREKSSIVSDEEMQNLWARILAEEANSPGAFSRKTVNLMGDLDKRDAELFTSICGFVWEINAEPTLALFRPLPEVQSTHGITTEDIPRLVGLGLISPIPSSGFAPELHFESDEVECSYLGRQVVLRFDEARSRSLYIGLWEFTPFGLELYRLCDPEPVQDFFEYVYDRWAEKGIVPPRNE